MSHEQQKYRTVTIERRGYGRRYTWLPVDSLSREGFSIEFEGSYTRPEMIDIRSGDVALWVEGGRHVEATVTDVQREPLVLRVSLADARPLPPDMFVV